jgi:O-antigen/teichoic acid export membrane protein
MIQAGRVQPAVFQFWGVWNWSTVREIVSLSGHAAMINLSIQISHKIDSFVIALFLPLQAVGAYELVFRFMAVTQQVAIKVSEGAIPRFAHSVAQGQRDQARKLFLRISSLSNLLVCLMLLLIGAFYPDLFALLSRGRIPIEATWPVLAVAAPIAWTGGLQMAAGPYLFVSGRERYLTVSSLITAFSNLLLSLLLVKPLGLVGVALGTLIPQLIQHQFSLIRRTCMDLQIGLWEYIRMVHGTVFMALALASMCLLGVLPWSRVAPLSLPVMLGLSLLASFVATVSWLGLTTSRLERLRLWQQISKQSTAPVSTEVP